MSHYMLPHLIKNRDSDKFRGFSYRKKLIEKNYEYLYKRTGQTKRVKSLVIAWDVYYQDAHLSQFDTLKEVKHYIYEKANS